MQTHRHTEAPSPRPWLSSLMANDARRWRASPSRRPEERESGSVTRRAPRTPEALICSLQPRSDRRRCDLQSSACDLADGSARRRAMREHAAVSPAAPAKERAGTPAGNHRGIRRALTGERVLPDGLPGSSLVKEHRTARLIGRTHHERRRSQEAHDRFAESARRTARAGPQRTTHCAC